MIELGIAVAVALFLGALAGLRYAASRTATTKDDKVLAFLEKIAPFVESLKKPEPPPPAP
jgi:hypothetical protein